MREGAGFMPVKDDTKRGAVRLRSDRCPPATGKRESGGENTGVR
jgi:hypothetical protein